MERANAGTDSAALNSTSTITLVGIVVISILVGILSSTIIQRNRESLSRAYDTRFDLQKVLTLVVDRETGVRGFTATREPLFLAPYDETSAQVTAILATLRGDARNGSLSAILPLIDDIERTHAHWTKAVAQQLIARPSLGASGRLQIEGKTDIDRIRVDVARAQGIVGDVLLRERLVTRVTIASAIAVIIVFSVVLGVIGLLSERRRLAQERKLRAEIAARNLELQSQRASVLALNQLKDDLIAVLAHDFKGPLTTIIGFAELLEQGLLEGADSDDALRTIRKSAMRLAALANDTLALSRVEQGELNFANDPVNIGEILRDIAQSMRAQREVTVEELSSDPVVLGDPPRLRQVFENIVGNAIKYSPEGQPVLVRIIDDGEMLRTEVSDRGIGVPEDEIKFLFERFTRASNAKRSTIKGTGLGLYLAKTLVERHGGEIEVRSAVGEGSTFTVVLPKVREGAPGVRRILLATADENLGPFVQHELRTKGYAVRRDTTLEAVVERLDVEPFHLILIDRDTIAGDISQLYERATAGKTPIALVRIGGNSNGEFAWAATLSNPFLSADLHAILQRIGRDRTHHLHRSQ